MSRDGITLPPFPPACRASGLLLHVTSLPSPYGIGDLGPAALSWIDRLHEAGQSWWQALPLGPTGRGPLLTAHTGKMLEARSRTQLLADGLENCLGSSNLKRLFTDTPAFVAGHENRGLGSAMVVDGVVEPMELGHLPYKRATYEDYVGLRG